MASTDLSGVSAFANSDTAPSATTLELERQVAEQILPIYMLHVLLSALNRKGSSVSVNPQIIQALDVAQEKGVMALGVDSATRIALKIDADAEALFRRMSVDDGREGVIGFCRFVLKLVEDGLTLVSENQAVLVALGIMAEAEEHPEQWSYYEGKGRMVTDRLLVNSRLLGYYLG